MSSVNLIEFDQYAKYLDKIGLTEEARIIDEYVTYRIVDLG